MHEVVVIYAAAIPVGHRVEVRWLAMQHKGLLGGAKLEERPWEPVVIDLDTGIEYCSDRFLSTQSFAKRVDAPLDLGRQDPNAAVARTLTGRVTACRVVTIRTYSHYDVQTHLTIAP
jgi:hypothetical protein